MQSRLRIIVTGLIAQHPRLGGVTWDYLQYAVGLARLGHDVYYFEDSGEWPYTLEGGTSSDQWIAYDCSANLEHLAKVMSRYGLGDKWAYFFPVKRRWHGLSNAKRREVVGSADLLINVSGTLKRPLDYRSVGRIAYVDSDPAFTQIKLNLSRGQKKFRNRVASHDVFFSFGERFSERVPETGYSWQPTRQPIVLSEWHADVPSRSVFTTVMSWASYKPLRYRGRNYGQKDVEFARFLELPKRVGHGLLEVALGEVRHADWETTNGIWPESALKIIGEHPEWTPRELLGASGWHVVDAGAIGADPDSYRNYIESSRAEWSVAKSGYVIGQAGWFSCRSACYLAAGKPVIVEDTGFSKVLPVGAGILPFDSLAGAAEAIVKVQSDYQRQSQAARAIAETYFDSGRVLSSLVERAMGRLPARETAGSSK